MHYLKKVALISPLIISFSFACYANESGQDLLKISQDLEKSFNMGQEKSFNALFKEAYLSKVKNDYYKFTKTYKNIKWKITPSKESIKGNHLLKVNIFAIRNIDGREYSLRANQLIKIILEKEKIKEYNVINSESILETNNNLKISPLIPNKVLSGERYDLDLIVNEPLGDYIIAGGLKERENPLSIKNNPTIQIKPLRSGGLFKSVQAPIEAGSQTWIALIAHPNGLYTITKKIEVKDEK